MLVKILYFFLNIIFIDVWDILVAEQPSSEEWHIAIWSGSCLFLKMRIVTLGSPVPLDSVLRIVYRLVLVYSYKVVYMGL